MGWDRIGYIPRGRSNRTEQNSSGSEEEQHKKSYHSRVQVEGKERGKYRHSVMNNELSEQRV